MEQTIDRVSMPVENWRTIEAELNQLREAVKANGTVTIVIRQRRSYGGYHSSVMEAPPEIRYVGKDAALMTLRDQLETALNEREAAAEENRKLNHTMTSLLSRGWFARLFDL